MTKFPFSLDKNHNVILVDVEFGKSTHRFLLDTGASNTIIDFNTLLIGGYNFKDVLRQVEVETANGLIETHIFNIKSISALNIQKKNFEIASYDFLASGIISEFDGVLGLDFFENNKICIDFINSEITVS
jgi:hypothetical protein